MIRKLLPLSLLCLFICACSCASKQAGDATISPSASDVIVMDMQNGTARLKIHKKTGQTIHLKFASGDYTRMTAKLVSADENANVRFTQIEMPNGEADGPFGREMTYSLPVRGDYTLNISENLMAGDPWTGDFEVMLSLDK